MPARGSVRLSYQLQLSSPGPFSQTIPLYVDDDGLRTLELTIHGVAAAGQ